MQSSNTAYIQSSLEQSYMQSCSVLHLLARGNAPSSYRDVLNEVPVAQVLQKCQLVLLDMRVLETSCMETKVNSAKQHPKGNLSLAVLKAELFTKAGIHLFVCVSKETR